MKIVIVVALAVLAAVLLSQPARREQVGPLPDGGFLLNSGWRVLPAGKQLPLETLPMTVTLSPDGKYAAVLHGGYRQPSVVILETASQKQVSRVNLPDAWLGLTFAPKGNVLYVGGGSRGAVYELTFDAASGQIALGRTFDTLKGAAPKATDFIGDVTVSPDGRLVYAAALYKDAVMVINPQTGTLIEQIATGRRPYRLLFHPDGQSFFVSSWADGSVYHHKAESGDRLGLIRLGPHTTDMLLSNRKVEGEEAGQDAFRLFVTASNTNNVYVVGVSPAKDLQRRETINLSLTPRMPVGMTPSALALNADQTRLYVACSDANAVAVVNVQEARSRVAGFVPVGWYPTAVRVLPSGQLMVLNGKGAGSFPNRKGPQPTRAVLRQHEGLRDDEYTPQLQAGSASLVDAPGEEQLEAATRTVLQNSPYRDNQLDDAQTGRNNPVPGRPGDASPIQHVIYIVKENRTYDQVLGDLGKGNGEPSLVLFDQRTSPNHRKLAREFVLFDNFYVSADVSADGHNWSSAAIAPDYVQKLFPNSYAGRRKTYDYEGGEPAALPPAGHIWNNAASAGISMRNYGWWSSNRPQAQVSNGEHIVNVRDGALAPVTNRKYRAFDLDYPDVERARTFIADLQEMEKTGNLPKLIFLRIGNDHTSGTAAGKVSPLSSFADNDYALGLIVEAVSKSKFWPSTAIFVLEDDAQNGPDHVDSHRSPAFVLSPYTRRGLVDSTLYNTTSMLRTMELIVGLRPMTHYDASARPMSAAFSAEPNLAPYTAEKPAYPLDERNPAKSATAARSARLRLEEADEIDDDEMNDILWHAIKGTEPPAPVRSYFGR